MMVRVSEIPLYSACPVRLKLVRDGASLWKDEKRRALHVVHKEWALRYHIALAHSGSIRENLLSELSWVRENVPRIHTDIARDTLSYAISELSDHVDDVAAGLSAIVEREEEWMLEPVKVQHTMYSDGLGLGGMVDKLVADGRGGVLPSIIRTGSAPATGVWESDRLQATGYALLLEEKEGRGIGGAQVEYASMGVVRRLFIRASDRRECLRCVEGIRALEEGGRAKPNHRMCKRCSLKEECPSTGTLLSKLLERL